MSVLECADSYFILPHAKFGKSLDRATMTADPIFTFPKLLSYQRRSKPPTKLFPNFSKLSLAVLGDFNSLAAEKLGNGFSKSFSSVHLQVSDANRVPLRHESSYYNRSGALREEIVRTFPVN